jgi:hypothetical protein
MPTDQVTNLHPPVVHYPPCDRDHYGRAVMALLDLDVEITASRVRGWVWRFRETAECGCLEFRVRGVQADLARARAAFKACLSEANAERVERLTGELSALRAMA